MPPVREKDQLRLVLPWPAQQSRPRGAGPLWSGPEAPGPYPQGVHSLARKQIMYNLEAGPDSSPINNHLPQTWKGYSRTPTTEKAKAGTGEETNGGPKIDGGRWCQGRQKSEQTLAQTGPAPGVAPLDNPAPTGRAQAPNKALHLHIYFSISC